MDQHPDAGQPSRTLVVSRFQFPKWWAIYLWINGVEYHPLRAFSLREIQAWAASNPLTFVQLSEGDEFDACEAPEASTPNPKEWDWYPFTLSNEDKPTIEEMVAACQEAIKAMNETGGESQ